MSDFVGLFIFPYFLSSFSNKGIKTIYFFSAILFLFWKSEYSQPIIDLFNNYGFGIDRTIDYSNLISISILPLSYNYRVFKNYKTVIEFNPLIRALIIFISCFSFIATSVQKHFGEIKLASNFKIESKDSFETIEKTLGLYPTKNNKYKCNLEIPKKSTRVILLIKIEEIQNKNTIIKLDSILTFTTTGDLFGINNSHIKYLQFLKVKDFEDLFLK